MTFNLDEVLADVYKRSVALKDNDFQRYYTVFGLVFRQLQEKMKAVDPYYARYSSRKEFTGSHSDRLRIGRPDEFDVDIVIRLPTSDLFIEKYSPGFVRLRTGSEFSGMCSNDDHNIKQVVSQWVDDSGYLLRTEFTNWFKSVVARAINQFPQNIIRSSRKRHFHLSIRDSGPACTLIVKGERNFLMSVDLVPALEFTEDKWPHDDRCYRQIPAHCRVGSWLVVPKGTSGSSPQDPQRIWRVSLHAQEKRLIHGTRHLRQAIRLTKKVRDTLELNEIASYYIKTLFLWELEDRKCEFWKKRVGFIFNIMVRKLYEAVRVREIPFFWNPRHNLIGHVDSQLLHDYELRLKNLVDTLEEAETRLRDIVTPALVFLLSHKIKVAYGSYARDLHIHVYYVTRSSWRGVFEIPRLVKGFDGWPMWLPSNGMKIEMRIMEFSAVLLLGCYHKPIISVLEIDDDGAGNDDDPSGRVSTDDGAPAERWPTKEGLKRA
ncbi:Cyclic GMP-AMP synthase [Eumeta japonica]|uniref:Cyclic GMP-AMP synthase n=1 Tax=Eumeta variegata TaxID=151549 RepID=A0A4C1W911_EUMVA|nr:Cyclic GMP-AMP synthase [Eumeta japonica]